MNYHTYVHCDDTAMHVLEMDDGVIRNWLQAMSQDGCEAMERAVPQMQCALLEWRANWLGPAKTLKQVEDDFQDIHDFWIRELQGQQHPAADRLPGDWSEHFPPASTSRRKPPPADLRPA